MTHGRYMRKQIRVMEDSRGQKMTSSVKRRHEDINMLHTASVNTIIIQDDGQRSHKKNIYKYHMTQ